MYAYAAMLKLRPNWELLEKNIQTESKTEQPKPVEKPKEQPKPAQPATKPFFNPAFRNPRLRGGGFLNRF